MNNGTVATVWATVSLYAHDRWLETNIITAGTHEGQKLSC